MRTILTDEVGRRNCMKMMGIANGSSSDTLFRGYGKLAKSNYVITMPSKNSAVFYNTLRDSGINSNALVRDIQDYSSGINITMPNPTMTINPMLTMTQDEYNQQTLERIAKDAKDRDAMVADASKELLPSTPVAGPSRNTGPGARLRKEATELLQSDIMSDPSRFATIASNVITTRSMAAPMSPLQRIGSYIAGADRTKSKTP